MKSLPFLKYLSVVMMISLIIPVALPLTTMSALTESSSVLGSSSASAYVSPVLLEDDFWKYGSYVEDPAFLSFESPVSEDTDFFVVNENTELGRVMIVLEKGLAPTILKGKVRGLLGVLPTHLYNVVLAIISRDDLRELTSTRGVLAVLPDVRIDALINKLRIR